MIIDELLAELRRRDIRLRVVDDKLKVDAPPGALDAALTQRLKEAKPALLERLAADAPPPDLPPVQRRAPGQTVPLPSALGRMLALERLLPGSAVHHIATVVELDDSIDPTRLRIALQQLHAHHEALRCHVTDVELIIRDSIVVEMQEVDARGMNDAELDAAVQAEAHRAIDLTQAPLARWCLYRTRGGYLLQATLHGMIYDGWSGGVIYRDLIAAYEGQPLIEPSVQIGDVACWEAAWLRTPAYLQRARFWREELRGLPDLGIGQGRAAHRGREISRQLQGAAWQGVQALARATSCGVYVPLLAAMHVCLWRVSGQRDVAVLSPVAGRWRGELESVVGCLLNLVVQRGRVEGQWTWRRLLEETRQQVLNRLAHQAAPLGPLLDDLADLDEQRPRLPSILFNHMAAHERSDRLAWPRARALRTVPLDASAQDLAWYLVEHEDHLLIKLRHDSDRFSPEQADALLDAYLAFLQDLLARPDGALSAAPQTPSLVAKPRGAGGEEPEGPEETALAAIMAAELGLECFGRYDNFFELGGTSLQATRLIQRVESQLGWRIEPPELFARNLHQIVAGREVRI